jgi:acyl-activating enzyme 14
MLAGMNNRFYLEAMLAITAAGCVCCPLNPRWSSAETEHAISICEPSLALVGAGFSLPHSPATPLQNVVLGNAFASDLHVRGEHGTADNAASPAAGTSTSEELIREHYGAPLDMRVGPHGTAFICFTSGASAAAKAVEVSHLSLHVQSLAKLAAVGYHSDDVFLHIAPLFHIGVSCWCFVEVMLCF